MKTLILTAALLSLTSCASMNESLELGAGIGALVGGAATYVAQSSSGQEPPLQNVAVGAAVGMTLGLLTSYLTHRSVENYRQSFQEDQTEMHFGDLPPSPFIVPKINIKKGVR
jgi:ABC-type Fe3+-siderophore transport system permease subunit